jgi:hypothetical protein
MVLEVVLNVLRKGITFFCFEFFVNISLCKNLLFILLFILLLTSFFSLILLFRDYFPYWIQTPWKTIAVLTSNASRCDWYEEVVNAQQPGLPIYCGDAPWSRDNHLGSGRSGWQNMYNFTVPTPSQLCGETSCDKCVLRLRYNISTTDYPWDLDASANGEKSPVEQNPVVDIGVRQGFKLAINTAQTGRTFQDRSHIFSVVPRPAGVSNQARIHNLMVQGKRGNIVETFPAVEYNFMPEFLRINENDYVHIQWTGSNTHDNDNPAGDGQAGDSGEGTGGTDRHNIVQITNQNVNYPLHISRVNMWSNVVDSVPRRSSSQVPFIDSLSLSIFPLFFFFNISNDDRTYHANAEHFCVENSSLNI